jgi:3-hydroxyisobutyrate dehydrogenase
MTIGYIGLGALGGALARRLLASQPIVVWDIDLRTTAALAGAGATAAASAAELGRRCDIVLLCLPRSTDVRELLFGAHALAENLGAGGLVIDQTSGLPGETREMADRLAPRGIALLDAAVSASPQIVPQGGAVLMAAGPDDVLARALPVLRMITGTVHRCGSRVGDGQALKTINNAINCACRIGTLELVALGRRLGLPLSALTLRLNEGLAANQTTLRMLPAIAEGRASTDFALALMLKDMNQATLLGRQTGAAMPIIGLARDLVQIGLNTVGPAARLDDLVCLVETLSGARFATGPVATRAAAEEARLLETIAEAVAALNALAALEGVSAGLRYGLGLADMAAILPCASGWSGALRQVLPALASGERPAGRPLRLVRDDLHAAARLSEEAGAPAPILSALRSVIEAAVNRLGGGAGMDALWSGLKAAA